jgi:hypothetical protein
MTLKDLEAVMYHQQWCQMNGSTEEQGNEMALAEFEGYCYQCEQQGHKADACPNRKFYCQNCGKQGHIEQNGWLKEENKNKRPQGHIMPSELANSVSLTSIGMTMLSIYSVD